MRNSRIVIIGTLLSLVVLATGCGRSAQVDAAKLTMFAPLPDAVPAPSSAATEAQISLGRMLYYEPRLSKSQTISCNSCHKLSDYGVDGEATSQGHRGQRGDRNAPTVYNAAAHFVQFWDGRAPDVEAQAKGPMLNPVEMAMGSDKQAVAVLKSMPGYVDAFKKAFPDAKDPVTFDNVAVAIGAFERKLITPSRWDRFVKGDQTALQPEEKIGFNTFTETGCGNCHAGALLGGNLYQKLGVVKAYPDTADPGRFKVTKAENDRMYFKVPSLRNIEKTGPYFHNGKVATLQEAVAQMADYQLGRKLSASDTASIVAFLKTLTGEIPADYIKQPELPKSTAKTPKAIAD
jgi:cytochrome c peroxidase